jgi:transposase
MEALTSEASILTNFKGIAVHDCWKPYFKFENADHALCGAHLLRELNGLIETGSQWAEKMRAFLLGVYGMPHPVEEPETIRQRYRMILNDADWEEPPPSPGRRGKPKQTVGRNLLDRLRMYEDGVLAFAFDADIPFTNNQAERDLRGAKVKLKVSGCFRTEEGARIYACLQAFISTARKRGENVFAKLRALFSSPPVPVT